MRTRSRIATAIVGIILLLTAATTNSAASIIVLSLNASTGVQKSGGAAAANGDAVAKWVDQSPAANDANYVSGTSPVYNTSVSGGPAVDFLAADSHLSLSSPLLTSTTYFRIDARINGSGTSERVIAANYGFGNFSGLEFYVYNQKLTAYIGYVSAFVSGTTNLADNTWYDVALERIGGGYTLYLNGLPEASGSFGGSGTFGGAVNMAIGGPPNYSGSPNGSGHMSFLTIAVPEPSIACAAVLIAATVLFGTRRRASTI